MTLSWMKDQKDEDIEILLTNEDTLNDFMQEYSHEGKAKESVETICNPGTYRAPSFIDQPI